MTNETRMTSQDWVKEFEVRSDVFLSPRNRIILQDLIVEIMRKERKYYALERPQEKP